MDFYSDNAATICPEVMAALQEANAVDLPYDGDKHSGRLSAAFSELFEKEVTAYWVSTGTAANALALAALCPPHGAIICHREAHIQNDECGAPEFYTYGAKLLLADGPGAKLTPDSIETVMRSVPDDVHRAQPQAISITNATEYGQCYRPEEVADLGQLARDHGLGFHMDGARFANAVAFLDCSPADLTWKAGVDALSFGFVKNGGMSAEALIFFRPDLGTHTGYRRKRAGHLLSKGRYSATQILAMLRDDVWLRNARTANSGAQQLAQAAGGRLVYPIEANEIFLTMTRDEAASLRAMGFGFHNWAEGEERFVVSWDQPQESIDRLADALSAL
ncbi:MAG: low specificity L-threonine aldolase [Sphingobium sp.]